MGENGGGSGMTRLEGLYGLLENGTSPSVRRMAAVQIGELVAAYPTKARSVLNRVRRLLLVADWDTRVAAGYAVKAISDQTPSYVVQTEENENLRADIEDVESTFLTFERVDLEKLLEHGVALLGSSGEEYVASSVDITLQRQQLRRDLGLDDRFGGGEDVLGLKDEDLVVKSESVVTGEEENTCSPKKQKADDYVAELEQGNKMSKREVNQLRREAKKRGRGATVDATEDPDAAKPKKRITSNTSVNGSNVKAENVVEEDIDLPDNNWIFASTCEELKLNLLAERWEARHGAAVGLREILKKHAASGGRVSPGENGIHENYRWLEDVCCRLLCVLALDRFGDFVGDGVVAPVRETASMAIAAAAKAMDPTRVDQLLKSLQILLRTEKRKQWDVRHAALLGIKYLLSVSIDRAADLLEPAFDSILEGLENEDDDVRAVAAEALYPVAAATWNLIPSRIPELLSILWNDLLDLDDLSASTASLLRTLSRIYELADEDAVDGKNRAIFLVIHERDDGEDSDGSDVKTSRVLELEDLVPRLWPFFRHNSIAVRRAAIVAFRSLLSWKRKEETLRWLRKLCGSVLDRVFRNVLLESDKEALETSQAVWGIVSPMLTGTPEDVSRVVSAVQPYLKHWFALASHESRAAAMAFDKSVQSGTETTEKISAKKASRLKRKAMGKSGTRHHLGTEASDGMETASGSTSAEEDPEESILMQTSAAAVLGVLGSIWPSDDPHLEEVLFDGLRSPYALSRRVACNVIEAWGKNSAHVAFSDQFFELLEKEISRTSDCAFAEMGTSVSSLFTDVRALLQAFETDLTPETLSSLNLDVAGTNSLISDGIAAMKKKDTARVVVISTNLIEPATNIATTGFDAWETGSSKGKMAKKRRDLMAAVRMHVLASIGYLAVRRDMLGTSLAAAAVGAVVATGSRPLPKLVTPHIKALMSGVRTLHSTRLQEKSSVALALLLRRLAERGTPKPVSLVTKNLCKHLNVIRKAGDDKADREAKEIEHRGAGIALRACGKEFGSELFSTLPMLWEMISVPLLHPEGEEEDALLTAMLVTRTIVDALESSQRLQIAKLLPSVIQMCASTRKSLGLEAGMCLADVVLHMPSLGMDTVIRLLVPLLQKEGDIMRRRNAAAALRMVVDRLDAKIIPYAAFLVVPMMVRMVDQDEEVRDAAAGVFGTLVRLMPLEEGAPDDPGMSSSMQKEREEAREFLGQLLGSRPRTHFEMPIPIGDGVELRHYQQECLDWLYFLNRYGLHGALCDDMGLGKTLMTLCILAAERHRLRQEMENPPPSLVICPSTIVAHWQLEALRFFGKTSLRNVVMYIGPPRRRAEIRAQTNFGDADVVITSYEALSSDLDHFRKIQWNYQVLDEGHVIKNAKTKVAKAVRCISAEHRLLLSGTPIQNTVLELWSIFDFLMPGFLGSEKSFKETYGKPIIASRDAKCNERDRERGMAAMESLHRQVLPFVLRRLKDDVLSELPPKVIQDYYCTMTPLQVRLYEDFSRAALKDGLDGNGERSNGRADSDDDAMAEDKKAKTGKKAGGHIFQALQYLRRLCSHPALVLNQSHSEYAKISEEFSGQGRSIHDLSESPKLLALEDLLSELGIGDTEVLRNRESGGHRVLVFAQMKAMLDLVETDLFRARMPTVTFLRMDGSVEPSKRQSIVTRFNADPTIDCLLLTTHVGGLGLNLTGADTVIFLEHDWNPTKDLQAMDRAHRIGQKRTVNVYRFIMRGTLEEKIMGIQKFKTHIANAVVNRENSSLSSMNTSDLLNLFHVDDASAVGTASSGSNSSTAGIEGKTGKGLKAAVEQLGEIWDEQQYKDEYNLDEFVQSITDNGMK